MANRQSGSVDDRLAAWRRFADERFAALVERLYLKAEPDMVDALLAGLLDAFNTGWNGGRTWMDAVHRQAMVDVVAEHIEASEGSAGDAVRRLLDDHGDA